MGGRKECDRVAGEDTATPNENGIRKCLGVEERLAAGRIGLRGLDLLHHTLPSGVRTRPAAGITTMRAYFIQLTRHCQCPERHARNGISAPPKPLYAFTAAAGEYRLSIPVGRNAEGVPHGTDQRTPMNGIESMKKGETSPASPFLLDRGRSCLRCRGKVQETEISAARARPNAYSVFEETAAAERESDHLDVLHRIGKSCRIPWIRSKMTIVI